MRLLKYAEGSVRIFNCKVDDIMGFFRKQEEKLATQLLRWKYQKMNISAPDPETLKLHATRVVDDAHRIAKERGSNVISIIKELIAEVKKQ